jgi:hypothetical protein
VGWDLNQLWPQFGQAAVPEGGEIREDGCEGMSKGRVREDSDRMWTSKNQAEIRAARGQSDNGRSGTPPDCAHLLKSDDELDQVE